MKKLFFLLLISGCAEAQQQPTDAQKAVIAYYADKCQKQGVDPNNTDAMRGCIWVTYQRDVQTGVFGQNHLGEVLQGLGSVYSAAGSRGQQRCDTSPDYRGGWTTTCY